ncbi:MAG TPA: hypothetical protein EYO90_03095 [Candidatus Latescibacteria bacterium]|nr:hypothetical protein [Candidatus Latescibacterota bacterium]
MRRLTILTTAGAFALAALACSGNEADSPAPSGNAMVPSAAGAGGTPGEAGDATPVIERVALTPARLIAGADIKAIVEATDPDGDMLRFDYVWSYNGRPVQQGSKSIFHPVALKKGDRVEVRVTATDGRHISAPMSARAQARNRPPILSAVTLEPFGDIRSGEVITAAPIASDPDNDRLRFTYRWTVNGQRKGRERTFDTSGLKRGDHVQAAVIANDGTSDSREKLSPVLMLGNSPPTITQLPASQSDNGTFEYRFAARDPDGDRNLRFFIEKGPAGARMDSITGVLTWTPTVAQVGIHPIEVGVEDSAREGTTFLFELTVRASHPLAPQPAARGY